MKHGHFFRAPQCPADVELLWRGALPLDQVGLPSWLNSDVAASYRRIASIRLAALSPDQQRAFFSEVAALDPAGVVPEEDPLQPGIWHVYLPRPVPQAIFSIGIWDGPSPLCLSPAGGADRPVLSRNDVTDVSAEFVADPFMIKAEGVWWMFFEVMNWHSRKGEIACAMSPDGISWRYQGIVLVEPFHLSYPYVFEHDGRFLMVPESFQAQSVRLYEASRMPWEWRLVATLLEGPYFADPSLVLRRGMWWLFVESPPRTRHDTLSLFCSPSIEGPWREHPRSPIVVGDKSRARPAGRIVRVGKKLVRFAQDCTNAYGGAVRASEILELDEYRYRERPVGPTPILAASGAAWRSGGMHHLDAHPQPDGSWIGCVDGWCEGI